MLRRHRWSENLATLASALNEQPPEGHQQLSGYEEEFVNAVDEDLICPICKLPLRSPVLTSCGHRFCKGCIDELCKRENVNMQNDLFAFVHVRQVTCPVDRTTLLRDKDVFPDKFTERKILSLVIKCPNKDCKWTGELKEKEEIFSLVIKCSKEGCKWTGELKEKEKHRKCCPREVVKCTNLDCRETMARSNLEDHVTTGCQWRKLRCEHCSMQHPACQQSEHQLKCKKFPVNCPRSCGKLIPREETKKHKAICPEEVVKCTSDSCTETMARKNLEKHVATTCQWRMLRCGHCSIQHPACKQSDHQLNCKRIPVNCPNKCGEEVPREEMEAHSGTVCPMVIVSCPFAEMDCQTKVRRSELSSHVQTATSDHLDLARVKLTKAYEEHEELKQWTRHLEEKLDNTLKEHEELKKTTRKLEEKLDYAVYVLSIMNN